ncbi:hypothetical protein EMPG_09361 [Blastomyces silverae]|uniref:Uncharacterized protein n=1 Tax=Blastomyces silverae TaxID=2060906 RepID=A0A0H1B8Q8_9EURO|nr:hypothetical protein EMPG_09361 [Blastomyces silverae]
MAGKMTGKPYGDDIEQNTQVQQGPVSSGNQTQGRANSSRPNENAALKDKNTKGEATQGKESQNVHAWRTNKQISDQNIFIKKDATNGGESQLNDTTNPDPNGKGNVQGNGRAKENAPITSDRSTVPRTTTPPPNRPAAFFTRSASPEKMSDKTARASKNDRSTASSSGPNSTTVDKMEAKANPQDPWSRGEMADMSAKACQSAAMNSSTPISSRLPSPSKLTTERNVQSAPSSALKGIKANNVTEDATIVSGQSTNGKKKTRRSRKKKKKPSTMDQEDAATDNSSKSDASSPTKLRAPSKTAAGEKSMAIIEASVNPEAVIGKVDIDTKEQSSKGNGARSRAPSPVNRDGIKPTNIDNVFNAKATAPNNEEPVNGDQSPANGGREETFAGLGSGQSPSFTKTVHKRNRPWPGKAEKLPNRQAATQADSPGLENNTQDIYERPGLEDDTNDHSMISIADIPSDDELGAEKIEEIFGRNDVPDSSKLEGVKVIMMKQNQIIARKTQLVNKYHKENEELQERVGELDSSILTQEDDNSEQQAQIDKLKTIVDELQRRMQNQESFIQIAEQDKSRLEEELNSSSISLKSTEIDRKALKESVSKMENDMVQMQNDIAHLIGERNGFLVTIGNYQSERDMMLCQLQNGPTQEENVRLEAELLEKNAELVVANQNFKDLQREYIALKKCGRKEQGKRTPSALSTELLLLGDGKEDDWEPAIDQSGVERNPFAPLPSPVTTPALFQFGELAAYGYGMEKNEIKLNIPKTFLHQTGEETKNSESPICLNAGTQTEITPSALSSTPKNEPEVSEASTQTPAYVELGTHSSTQTNVVEMLEASAQTIAGAGANELGMLEASTQTVCELGVSRGNQTVKLDILEASTQTETVCELGISRGNQTVKLDVLEASTQTEVEEMVHEVKMLEASTQTDKAAGAREMIDMLVQTEPVTVTQGSELARSLRLALIMFAWAAIILWGHKEDQRLWLDANGVSRAALVGMRDRSLGPFLWIEQLRYELVVWLQVDRVLPG